MLILHLIVKYYSLYKNKYEIEGAPLPDKIHTRCSHITRYVSSPQKGTAPSLRPRNSLLFINTLLETELVLTYFFFTSAKYFQGVFATRRTGNITVGGDGRGENPYK